jgi:hypothetical protein
MYVVRANDRDRPNWVQLVVTVNFIRSDGGVDVASAAEL